MKMKEKVEKSNQIYNKVALAAFHFEKIQVSVFLKFKKN